jgi:S1-C subfamily serine protease
MSGRLRAGGALLAAAFVGGGAAFGLGTAIGRGSTTTVVREEATPAPAPVSFRGLRTGQSIQEIYREESPGVVLIRSTQVVTSDPFFGPQEATAEGSGFVIDKAGHIVTNYHVVENARDVRVIFSDEKPYGARVVGSDPSTDIAVLQVEAPAGALTPLRLGNSDGVRVGDPVVAIGNPLGLERTITAGIVSALQRQITSPNGFPIDKVIQTDAAVNHGNSGGPLLSTQGDVIGVNSQIETGSSDPSSGNIGIGFAIPINTVREVVSQIIETGKVEHAYLGIQMQDVTATLAETVRLPANAGVLVTQVVPSSPAAKAGLEGGSTKVTVDGVSYTIGGDVITKVNGKKIRSSDDVRDAIRSKRPGNKVTLQIHRGEKMKDVTIELGRQPSTPAG